MRDIKKSMDFTEAFFFKFRGYNSFCKSVNTQCFDVINRRKESNKKEIETV